MESRSHPVLRLLTSARHVPVNTDLVAIFGLSAAYLLQQFCYWSERLDDARDGWFYKSREEIVDELKLSRKEQETARKHLTDAGVLEEQRRGMPARMWYRIDFDRLEEALLAYSAELRRRPTSDADRRSGKADFQLVTKSPTRRSQSHQQDGPKVTDMLARKSPAIIRKTTDDRQKKTATATAVPLQSAFPLSDGSAVVEPVLLEETVPDPHLVRCLSENGLNRVDALRLAAADPDECRRQLDYLPFVSEFKTSQGAYLRAAIEQGFAPPRGWQEAQGKARQSEQRRQRRESEADAARERDQAEATARTALEAEKARLQVEDPERWAEVIAEAEKLLPPPLRGKTAHVAYAPALHGNIERILQAAPQGKRTL